MNIYLRDATYEDKDLLYEWANDEDVRKNSFSTGSISYDEHCIWFDNMMKNESIVQWILQEDDKPVGQIRITINGSEGSIGYSVSADRRGVGLGKIMLNLAIEKLSEDYPVVKKLVAKVKPENIASLKVFQNNGFEAKFQQLEFEIG